MQYRFESFAQFMRARDKQPAKYSRFDFSPGGAASLLGVSRQRVYQLIADGVFDYVKAADGYGLLDRKQVEARKSLSPVSGRPRLSA